MRPKFDITFFPNLHVVGSGDDPVLPGDELGRSNGKVADFERLDLKHRRWNVT